MQVRQASLEARLQSLPDLRQTLADVMRVQQRRELDARQAQQQRLDQQELATGNRGYLVRKPPASGEPAVSITVYPPETVPDDGATEALVYDP